MSDRYLDIEIEGLDFNWAWLYSAYPIILLPERADTERTGKRICSTRFSVPILLKCLLDEAIRRLRPSTITRGPRQGRSRPRSATPLACLPHISVPDSRTRIYELPVEVTTVYGLSA